ncbi:MAG: hypothetical protein FD160_3931 [Caulobacteraceae bacterium]|jgi:hypothetical protein|nr:MAG: hypothetical protein FD160_3931 [Caulobacteraceae bacterium]
MTQDVIAPDAKDDPHRQESCALRCDARDCRAVHGAERARQPTGMRVLT